MFEFVLGVPVHSGLERVQLDEAVVAEAFVAVQLGDVVAVGLEVFVGEDFWHCELFGLFFLLLLICHL